MDWHRQQGPGLSRISQAACGAGIGAFVGLVIAILVHRTEGFRPLLIVMAAGLVGAIITYVLSGSLQRGNATPALSVRGDYPRWLVTLFSVSLAAFVIGLLSMLYTALVGFSIFAFAGTYLIPISIIALYYILGAAERCASK
jgi:hypothetical protein